MDATIRSMTGYGRGEYIAQEQKFSVEIRSVNHRYHDITVKLPRSLNALEDKIKKRIMQDVFRGKTDVYISLENFSSADVEVNLDEALAAAYLEKLYLLEKAFALRGENKLELVAKFSDVIKVERIEREAEQSWEALLPALEEAVHNLIAMRGQEGDSLRRDILAKKEHLQQLLSAVRERSPLVVQEYQEKLNNRLRELLNGVEIDQQRLAAEVAIFADKGCIDEEITRLASHLNQLQAILEGGGQVGRRLDFLVQEMNRETNTIASKANDLQIVQTTIEMKSEIEKIREQVQNLE